MISNLILGNSGMPVLLMIILTAQIKIMFILLGTVGKPSC